MIPRLYRAPENHSAFLFGPRGTGKTTWLREHFPDALFVDLLDDETYQALLASPGRLEEWLANHPKERSIVVDEIQRVPALLNTVHRLIENRKLRFVLTGSSARNLRKAGVNLLAGRALTTSMFPLTSVELGERFSLSRSLKVGHLPMAVAGTHPKAYLKSYVVTYLREEVQQEGLVRNLSAFNRFLEAASLSQASILNFAAIGRECALDRKVVEGYFEILEDLLLSFRLPVFSRKAKRKLIRQKKFYLFDCGVFQAIRPRGPLDTDAEVGGAALETLVIQELRALNHYYGWDYELFYWHTADHKYEVDLVMYGERGLKAVEVKRSGRLRDEDFLSLRKFKEDYPVAEAYLFHGGARTIERFGISAVPISDTLRAPSMF